jgi:Ca2+-transporting ATPase
MAEQQENSPTIASTDAPGWHALDVKAVIEGLHTDPHTGLSKAEAARRLEQYGPNTLQTMERIPWYVVFGRQFLNGLILILVVAAAIALAIGEVTDAITILAIVVLNGILGFVQEWKAERAIEALQRMLSPHCTVVRDSLEQDIDAAALVPGDVVLLKIGDRVPADLRLVDAVAVATGMATEFGRIAQLTQAVGEETTPLQRKLGVLGRQLGILAIGVSILVGATGWLLGKPLFEMFLTGVALAVAVVPEGLPAVVTITLALGIRAMVRRRALLRRLPAAETLGAATVICTDKTGTLTQNEMTVQRVWLPSGEIEVTGVGYAPTGHFGVNGHKIDHTSRRDLLDLLETGLHCNHARLYEDADGWHKIGEPTEAALVVAARKAGLDPDEAFHSVTEFSFNSIRKRMTIVEDRPEGLIGQVKGAPEVILERCSRILDGAQERELSEADRVVADAAYQSLAEQGLRTLALARRSLPPGIALNAEQVERDLTLLGIVGIIDPPRPEVPDAIRLAYSAGIQIIMITGDASATALSIARRIGMRAERAISGRELDTRHYGRCGAARCTSGECPVRAHDTRTQASHRQSAPRDGTSGGYDW